MNAKGLLIKLAGIMLLGIIVVSCTPKKSAEQLAMEARIAELQAQLLELTADDETADENT